MGTVYLARDTRSEPERNHSPVLVALKVLAAKRAREEERTLARFLREMELARVVDHPHVTKTFETGTVDGVHFIAMEYIRGVSLRRQITAGGSPGGPVFQRGLRRIAKRTPQGTHPPRSQALEHDGDPQRPRQNP